MPSPSWGRHAAAPGSNSASSSPTRSSFSATSRCPSRRSGGRRVEGTRVARRRRRAQGSPPRARAAVATLPPARSPAWRFLPSARSILIGVGLVAVSVGAYATARQTSMFAVTTVRVTGAPAPIRAQVRRAAGALLGTSLLALDGAALRSQVEALPTVVSVSYDRAFPHTLRLT